MDLSLSMLHHGSEAPASATHSFRAGGLTVAYSGGELRHVYAGPIEVLNRVYVAVRDRNWATVPFALSDELIEAGADHFQITFLATHQNSEVDYVWRGSIVGTAAGALSFSFVGQARRTFWRCRIGFCLLHPAALAGAAGRAVSADGMVRTGQFPLHLTPAQPVPPFGDMQGLEYEAAPALWARLRFTGDLFELEDQRNWTDASFKTFCTPHHLPIPVEVVQGTEIRQAVEFSTDGRIPTGPAANSTPRLTFGAGRWRLPQVGFSVSPVPRTLSALEAARLRWLHPVHLRVEVDEAQQKTEAGLEAASRAARVLGSTLEVAVGVSADSLDHLRWVADLLGRQDVPVVRWLLHCSSGPRRFGAPDGELLARARHLLASLSPGAAVVAGTNTDFFFLNEHAPDPGLLDGICLAIHPQAHAFDDSSLIETLAIQGVVATQAAAMAGHRPVAVSPITLKPRFNPYAANSVPTAPGTVPVNVDARQLSLFGAGWTLGSIKYLAESGAASLTYYELVGPRGVIDDAAAPLPGFPSLQGAVFPLYHVLADVAEFRGGEVLALESSAPLEVLGLALANHGQRRILLANLTGTPARVALPELRQARVRHLDEHTAHAAMLDPDAFRAQPGQTQQAAGGLEIELEPYALATLEVLG
jgi:hypothetical protein